MKSLYDANGKYTSQATDLDNATNQACKALFQAYMDQGYSYRDIAGIMRTAITDLELMSAMGFPPVESE